MLLTLKKVVVLNNAYDIRKVIIIPMSREPSICIHVLNHYICLLKVVMIMSRSLLNIHVLGGGRGRGRGGGSGWQEGDNTFGTKSDGNQEEKPRENYIPVERTTTDQELFTSTITTGINFMKLDEIEVNVSGEDVPPPIESFESSNLRPHLLENVAKSGYKKPTPIQKYAIPIIMNERDLMGCAQTGSGKTVSVN